jgi:hypothetical protein
MELFAVEQPRDIMQRCEIAISPGKKPSRAPIQSSHAAPFGGFVKRSVGKTTVVQSCCSLKLREAYGSVNGFWLFQPCNVQKGGMAATCR